MMAILSKDTLKCTCCMSVSIYINSAEVSGKVLYHVYINIYVHILYAYSNPHILQPFILRPCWLEEHLIWSQMHFVYYWTFILRPPAI